MTVAAAIEIGTGGSPAPGLGKAQGAGRAGTASQSFQPSIAPGSESFRAGLQSLLSSMGSSVKTSSQSETEADRGIRSAGPALGTGPASTAVAGRSTVSTSTQATLRFIQKSEQGSTVTSAAATLSSSGARSESSTATKTEKRKSLTGPETESASGPHSAHSSNVAKPEVAAAEPMPGVVPAVIASLPQAVPAAEIASPIASGTDAKAQSAQTGLSADPTLDPSTGFASATLTLRPSASEPSSRVAGAAKAAAQKSAEESDTHAMQGELAPLPSPGGSSGPSLGATDSPNAQEDAPPPAAMRAEGGNPTQTLAQSRIEAPMQTKNQGEDAISTAMASDGLNQLPVVASAAATPSGQPSAEPPIVGKTGTASGGKSSEILRSAHGAGNFDSVQQVSHQAQGQASGASVDASAMARDLGGAHGAVSTAEASTVTTSGPDSREAFATLDAEGATGKPTWIHAGAQRAEAGFQDPALGWVGVRADTSGGGVHAELVPGSADALQALGGHLAGLNAYLAEHHTPVETLTLTAPESGWAGLGSDKGAGEGMQQGAGQQNAQGADTGFQSNPSQAAILPAADSRLSALPGALDGSAPAARPGGVHISVMA